MTEKLSPYTSWGKYLALFLLFLTFTYNLLARYLIIFQYSFPLDPDLTPEQRKYQSLKEALNISSSQYGLLTGPAFMAVFALFNLFSGFVADNFNRRITMTIGLLLTSISLGLMYWVQSFWQLFLLRSLLALGQAFFAPLGYSIIAAYFPDYKTTANSVFASGVYSGYGLASLALLFLPLPHVGWRNLSAYIAIIGGIISIFFFFIVWEPRRPAAQLAGVLAAQQQDSLPGPTTTKAVSIQHDALTSKDDDVNVNPDHDDDNDIVNTSSSSTTIQSSQSNLSCKSTIKQLSWFESVKISLMSSHVLALIGIFIPRLCGGGILGAFFPVLMKERFPHMKTKFAGMNAVVVSSGGILSSLIGGFLTDKWVSSAKERAELEELEESLLDEGDYEDSENKNYADFSSSSGNTSTNKKSTTTVDKTPPLRPYLYITALSCLLSLGAFAAVFVSKNLYLAMALLFVAYLFSECYFAPILSIFYTTPTLPPNARSTALSISLGISQLIASWAPVLFGYIEDSQHDLQTELLVGVLSSNALAGVLALLTACLIKK